MTKIRPTLRNRANRKWTTRGSANHQFLGMANFCQFLNTWFTEENSAKNNNIAIEIGSHMGEGLSMIAATQLFNVIHVIEPFAGEEEFNEMFGWSWEEVRQEWEWNTRHFKDIIKLHETFSYEIPDKFFKESVNLVYIDGDHSYESVKRDIKLYLPKIRHRGVIAGHDYHEKWPGVMKAVDEQLGKPDKIFMDSSWVKIIEKK